MSTGTDVAMNRDQVTLVKGDLRGISIARGLSQVTGAPLGTRPMRTCLPKGKPDQTRHPSAKETRFLPNCFAWYS